MPLIIKEKVPELFTCKLSTAPASTDSAFLPVTDKKIKIKQTELPDFLRGNTHRSITRRLLCILY